MTVTTVGSATVPARPDRATVVLDITRLAPAPDEAIADVVERVVAALALLDELGVGEADRSTSGVSVGEQREWRGDREVLVGHHSVERLQVRLADPGTIGVLLREAVGRVGASVRGPFWIVDPGNPARVEAYRLAAEDARRRAEAYASALGCRLGAVTEVREPGTAPGWSPYAPEGVALMAARAGGPPVPVEPGQVDVQATVTVTFALTPG